MALTQLLPRTSRSGTLVSAPRSVPPGFIGRKVILVVDTTNALHDDPNEYVNLAVEVSYDGGASWLPGGSGSWNGVPFVSRSPDRRIEATLNRGPAGEDPTHVRAAYAVTVLDPGAGSDGAVSFGVLADVV